MKVRELMFTPQFERLMMNTPARPCIDCMMWNTKTDGTPERPKGFPPKNKKELALKRNWPWRMYYKSIQAVFDIIEQSTLAYEYKLYGPDATKRIRRERKRNWKERLQRLKKQGYVETARKKRRTGKRLTPWEKTAYNEWRQEQKALEAARQRNDEMAAGD